MPVTLVGVARLRCSAEGSWQPASSHMRTRMAKLLCPSLKNTALGAAQAYTGGTTPAGPPSSCVVRGVGAPAPTTLSAAARGVRHACQSSPRPPLPAQLFVSPRARSTGAELSSQTVEEGAAESATVAADLTGFANVIAAATQGGNVAFKMDAKARTYEYSAGGGTSIHTTQSLCGVCRPEGEGRWGKGLVVKALECVRKTVGGDASNNVAAKDAADYADAAVPHGEWSIHELEAAALAMVHKTPAVEKKVREVLRASGCG